MTQTYWKGQQNKTEDSLLSVSLRGKGKELGLAKGGT